MPIRGRIELILGPMFAGKSTELLRRMRRLEISGKSILSVKYEADTRYKSDSISTHDNIVRAAVPCKMLSELNEIWRNYDVIGIDEGQFFEDIVHFSEQAANNGKIVILSALNGTYKRQGWSNVLELVPKCEKVKKLSAICKMCPYNADFTFRHVFSVEPEEFIGGAELYMPLCRDCYNQKSLMHC